MKVVQDLEAFHDKFQVGMSDTPVLLAEDVMKFRTEFLQEELDEMKKAAAEGDMVEIADAIVDLVYVAVGTSTMMGLPFEQLWDEVQRSNMAKISGREARADNIPTTKPPRHDLDVLKPLSWTAPDLKSILNT